MRTIVKVIISFLIGLVCIPFYVVFFPIVLLGNAYVYSIKEEDWSNPFLDTYEYIHFVLFEGGIN